MTSPVLDKREQLFINWLQQQSNNNNLSLDERLTDASVRKYYRITMDGQSVIAVDAPQDMSARFIAIGEPLRSLGIRVPNIYNKQDEQGFLIIEDFGDLSLQLALKPNNVDQLYTLAFNALLKMQTQASSQQLPNYDLALISRELSLFQTWFLETHHKILLNTKEQRVFKQAYELLSNNALEQPQRFMHRDYHSRNLMLLPQGNLGLLDFQDALHGPIAYDLVSLLRDCYIDWPEEKIKTWCNAYLKQLNTQLGSDYQQNEFERWFDLCGIQRHLKAIGIFSRLFHQDNKPNYLHDIPRTLNYIMDVTKKYPELHAFRTCLSGLDLQQKGAL